MPKPGNYHHTSAREIPRSQGGTRTAGQITALRGMSGLELSPVLETFLFLFTCQQVVKAGPRILDEIQDSLSEVKWGERVGAKRKHGAPIKHTGLSTGLEPEEKLMSGKNTWGEIGRKEKEKEKKKDQSAEVSRRRNLHLPLDEFKRLALSSSESDEGLSSSEETDLEEEAVHYKGESYQQDKMQATQSRKRQKGAGKSQLAAWPLDCRLQGPSAPQPYVQRYHSEPYVQRYHSDSFIPKEEQRKVQQAFPVFEGAEGGRVHAPVEYMQIKKLAEAVANFTIAQVERLANHAMTPGDWQTVVKAAAPSMGMYLEWKALWQDSCQMQARANATMEGDQRMWTFELLTGQGQHAANQTNYHWGAYAQISAAAVKVWKALSRKGKRVDI